MISGGQFNNDISNTFKNTCPLMVGELSDSRNRAENMQDDPRAFCSAIKLIGAQ